MKVLLCAVNSQYIHSNPALYSLARVIEREQLPLQLLRREYSINLPPRYLLRELYLESPDVLAFSTYIWNVDSILRLLDDLSRLLPQTTLLLGGPEAEARAEQLLAHSPALHGVLAGEGEALWPPLVQALARGETRPILPGLHWRGQPKPAPPCPPDLAALPFYYSEQELNELGRARKVVYYESSRGCPYQCSFCCSANRPLRQRPLPLVLRELPLLAQSGGQIKFVDRTFNADSERAVAITEAILDLYRPGLSWHFEISPYHLPPRLLQLWQQAPQDYLRLEAGLQSLHEPTLQAIGRHGAWPAARAALQALLQAERSHVHVDLIAGLPEETPHSFAQSFNAVHELAPHYLQLGFLKVLPGSPLAAQAAQRGIVYSPYPPYQVLCTPTMEAAYLFQLAAADKALNSLFNSGRFRHSLLRAAQLWPGGALALYLHLGQCLEQAGPGGLSLPQRAELLAQALLPLDEPLFFDLLRLDWLSYQDQQPLPPPLRHAADEKRRFFFHQRWHFEGAQAQARPGPAYLEFDWQQRLGVCRRAASRLIEP